MFPFVVERERFKMTFDGLPETGFVRIRAVIGPDKPIPISKSSWWAGIAAGRYPKPVKLGPHTTAWRVEDIRALIDSLRHQD
jgi:prophage regulatory protein